MRKSVPKGTWLKVLRESNFMCIYCGGDATEVDHIIPYSYSQNNNEENLVPACSTCNGLASNKIFDSLIEKIGFVQKRRKDKRLPTPEIVPHYLELSKLKRQPPPPEIKYKPEPIYETPPKRTKAKKKPIPTPLKFNNIKAIKIYLKQLSEDYSYENIGKAYGINKAIPWKIINKTYEPKTYGIRIALGLPVRVLVQTVNGYIEPGSISLGSKDCSQCGQPFISNAGKRKLCYRCLKPRDRKAEALKRKEAQNEQSNRKRKHA